MTERSSGDYCPSCGAQAAPGAAFCGECGAELAPPTRPLPVDDAPTVAAPLPGASGSPYDPPAYGQGGPHAQRSTAAPGAGEYGGYAPYGGDGGHGADARPGAYGSAGGHGGDGAEAGQGGYGGVGGGGYGGGSDAGSPYAASPYDDGSIPLGAGEPRRRGPVIAVVAVVTAVVLLGGGFALWSLLHPSEQVSTSAPTTSSAAPTSPSAAPSGSAPTASEPSASAAAPTSAAPSASPAPTTASTPSPSATGVPGGRRLDYQAHDIPGPFPNVGTLGGRTTPEFARTVAQTYGQSGADGGPAVLQDVVSTRTGRRYTMTCTPDTDVSVLCVGGNGAQVLIWK